MDKGEASYQDQLNKIWKDNLTVTKSLVLFQEEHGNGDVEASEHCCHYHQFITKVPEWISKKSNSQQHHSPQRQEEGI